ncbi:TPA: hypothetical protein ACHKRG_002774, partial [Enterococcus faecium]
PQVLVLASSICFYFYLIFLFKLKDVISNENLLNKDSIIIVPTTKPAAFAIISPTSNIPK